MPPTQLRPEELFKAEKARATSAAKSQHAKLLAEAKAAFDKLMAEGQAARKSGRPRKHPLPPLKTGSALRPPSAPPRFGAPIEVMATAPRAMAMSLPTAPAAPLKKAAKPKAAKAKPKAKAKAKAKKKR